MRKTQGVQVGFFHADPARFPHHFEVVKSLPYVGIYLCEPQLGKEKTDFLSPVREIEGKAWVGVGQLCLDVRSNEQMVDVNDDSNASFKPRTSLRSGWKEILKSMVDNIRETGNWDTFLGIYMDEPLLWGATGDMLCEITGYFRDLCPDKRVFICFSVAGVAPDVWTINNIQPITPQTGKYITDVAFDMYHPFDETYLHITEQMVRRMGNRQDLKYWFVPCVMNYRGNKSAKHCIDHTEGCIKLLKRFSPHQRGGLFCYTYHTFPEEEENLGNIGLDLLLDSNNMYYWKELEDYLYDFGVRVLNGELDD